MSVVDVIAEVIRNHASVASPETLAARIAAAIRDMPVGARGRLARELVREDLS